MPKYRFKCIQGHEFLRYAPKQDKESTCECGSTSKRLMPNTSAPDSKELIDSLTGTRWREDHEDILKQRRDHHYWKVEVPRLVQEYSVETCLENNWVYYDDKGKLCVRDKPPNKD